MATCTYICIINWIVLFRWSRLCDFNRAIIKYKILVINAKNFDCEDKTTCTKFMLKIKIKTTRDLFLKRVDIADPVSGQPKLCFLSLDFRRELCERSRLGWIAVHRSIGPTRPDRFHWHLRHAELEHVLSIRQNILRMCYKYSTVRLQSKYELKITYSVVHTRILRQERS